jgi:hypothetical protein
MLQNPPTPFPLWSGSLRDRRGRGSCHTREADTLRKRRERKRRKNKQRERERERERNEENEDATNYDRFASILGHRTERCTVAADIDRVRTTVALPSAMPCG